MFEALVLIIILFILFFVGVPVAFALGVTSVAGILLFLSPGHLSQIVSVTYTQGISTSLMVVPLFIMVAEIIVNGGISRDLYDVLSIWLRKVAGGLGISSILACTIFATLCGSSPVTAATVGRISIPQMQRKGYDKSFSIGINAVGGTIGILIPPSLALIIYGIITETSIAKLFMGGVLPGIFLALALSLYIFIKVKVSPQIISEKNIVEEENGDSECGNSSQESTSLRKQFAIVFPLIILIVLMLGTMYLGYVTPTEAGGVGALGALLIVGLTRGFKLSLFRNVFLESAKTSSMIIFLLICGMCFAFTLSALGIPHELTKFIVGISSNKWVILLVVYLLWLVLGCVMDPLGMIVITMPFLFPALVSLGFDPIWIGVVSTITVCIGMVTPPIGLNLFVMKGITGSSFEEVVSGTLPFLLVLVFVLIIVTIFPGIATFLPNTMG